MNNLFVFVEGDDDLFFIKQILYEYFLNKSVNLIAIPYQQTRNHIIKKSIKQAKKDKTADYLLISDLDSHRYPCITERKKARFDELNGEIDLNKIIIAKEEIENWFLAGLNCELEIFKDFDDFENTELITKEDFEKLINEKSINKFEFFTQLKDYYDFDLALKRSNSLKYFFDKYCS